MDKLVKEVKYSASLFNQKEVKLVFLALAVFLLLVAIL